MAAEIFSSLYQYAIDLHLYHFQTKSYAGHKASDMHLTRVRANTDTLLEVYQGIFGRLKVDEPYHLEVNNFSKTENIAKSTLRLNKYLNQLKTDLEGYSDLENLLDTIIGDNNQLLYLLTFN